MPFHRRGVGVRGKEGCVVRTRVSRSDCHVVTSTGIRRCLSGRRPSCQLKRRISVLV